MIKKSKNKQQKEKYKCEESIKASSSLFPKRNGGFLVDKERAYYIAF